MKQNRILKGIKIVLLVVAACAVFGFIVEGLWNLLIPPIFGWHTITFWQALGLLILSKILFGGFHRHAGGHSNWRRRMKERWEQMTPEQREQFRKGMHCHRGPFAAPSEPQS